MKAPELSEDQFTHASREEIMSALFAGMVIQNANMALMLLGKVAHPETGQTIKDVEAAKMFIDQLEMIEFKTKGNLSKEEEKLLKQSLATLHMAFVDAIESGDQPAMKEQTAATPAQEEKKDEPMTSPPSDSAESGAAPAEKPEESHKKFSKKY